MEWEPSLPSSDSRDFVGLYSNSNWYPCLMPGKEKNLALLLAHLLFPLRLEDLKKLFPGVLVYSLWITTFILMSSFFMRSESWNKMINAPRHLKQFFWRKKSNGSVDNQFCKARKLKVYTKIDTCSADFSIHFILFKANLILICLWAYELSLSLARSLKNTPDQITVDLQ